MQGKEHSAEQWINEYAGMLLAYTVARVNDTGVAEDIVQETFISAWKSRESYNGSASVKNWLFSICKNKIIDYYRKKSRSPVQYADADETQQFFNEADHWKDYTVPKEWHVDYNHPTDNKEFYRVLEFCKQKLQELQQRVFVLKYMEDMDSEDICKILQISSSNYWVLIHRAKLRLRNCLEKNWLNL
jgi:RNA polymerase sigma-70 factor, TIGR02943 family